MAAGLGVTAAQGRLLQTRRVDAAAHGAEALATGKVTAARATRDLALELGYTHVAASIDERVPTLTARISQIVAAGQSVADQMRHGRHAEISIDAYPHRSFDGPAGHRSGRGAHRNALGIEPRGIGTLDSSIPRRNESQAGVAFF